MTGFKELSYEDLFDLKINQNLSATEIAELFGVQVSSVCRKLKRFKLPTTPKRCLLDPRICDREWLYEAYIEDNLSVNKIAEVVGHDNATVKKQLEHFEIVKRKIDLSNHLEHIREMRESGQSWEEIAGSFGVSFTKIYNFAKKNKLVGDVFSLRRPDGLDDEEWLRYNRIELNRTIEDISNELNVGQTMVRSALARFNISHNSTTERISRKAYDIEWLREQHVDKKRTLTDIATECNCDRTLIAIQLKCGGYDTKRHITSTGEKEIVDHIRSFYTGTVETSNRKVIAPMELDIVIPDLKLAIEYCGIFWHSERFMDDDYHLKKLNLAEAAGYTLLTIFEDEWINRKEIVKRKLDNLLGRKTEKVFARKCTIDVVDKDERRAFLEQNHIQGDAASTAAFGLRIDGLLVAVLALKLRKHGEWEIVRYATAKSVVGGFSRLLSHFKRNYGWEEIVTFADRRWSTGNLYRVTGFREDGILKPTYSYADIHNVRREHRFNFRKERIRKLIGDDYDPKLSERQLMNLQKKYVRIYDCGLIRFKISK